MPVFKNEDNGTWYVMARYVNWKGERKQKCKRGFATKEYLERLIGLAQELTSTWTAKVTIAFPDYNSFEHREAVLMAKSSFENADFVNNIEVITYKPDFRDEVI